MFDTTAFKTKTIITAKHNPVAEGFWGIALDVGYSAVKGYSSNSVFCFPSYARKVTGVALSIGDDDSESIQYRDEHGTIWAVGATAQDMITSDETNDSTQALYGRNRYYSEMFKVLVRTGLGIGLMPNKCGTMNNETIVVQTGLPPMYMKSDTDMLRDIFADTHIFSLKVGNGDWIDFHFTLPECNVFVMQQPMGTLFSIATDSDGNFLPDANKYFRSNTLILDPGFGTLDVFSIRNGRAESSETFDDLGMKRVLSETSKKIFDKYHQEVRIPAMQKCLASGKVKCFNRKERSSTLEPFGDMLEESSKDVCMEALSRIDSIYNNLQDYDVLIVTGGTGAAWRKYIREYYGGMTSLEVINGNQNDSFSCVFSNVRGYYMFLIAELRSAHKR